MRIRFWARVLTIALLVLFPTAVQADLQQASLVINAEAGKYRRLGVPLGAALDPGPVALTSNTGYYVRFEGGTILYEDRVFGNSRTYLLDNQVFLEWLGLGGSTALGFPERTNEPSRTPGDRYAIFRRLGSSLPQPYIIYFNSRMKFRQCQVLATGVFRLSGDVAQKYLDLNPTPALGSGILGAPTGHTTRVASGAVSSGNVSQFEHGRIYDRAGLGQAYYVKDSVLERWLQMGGPSSVLGYPTRDFNTLDARRASSTFAAGSITQSRVTVPGLSFYTQNTALVDAESLLSAARAVKASSPIISTLVDAVAGSDSEHLLYEGSDRRGSMSAIVNYIRARRPAVVALQEIMLDGERSFFINELRSSGYLDVLQGPDENDLEEDGGMLLLSLYPFVSQHSSIFRACDGEDCLSNKGILHARIQPPGYPCPIDVFAAHFQNPDPVFGSKSEADTALRAQHEHAAQFVNSHIDPRRPAVLMGDFNLNTNYCAPEATYVPGLNEHRYLLQLYPGWRDAQTIARGTVHHVGHRVSWLDRARTGVTADRHLDFEPGSRLIDDDRRYKEGERLDQILMWPGTRYLLTPDNLVTVALKTPGNRDVSDHYGQLLTTTGLNEVTMTPSGSGSLEIRLLGVTCLMVTEGGLGFMSQRLNDDEVHFTLSAATGGRDSRPRPRSARSERFTTQAGSWGRYYAFHSPLVLRYYGDEVNADGWYDITVRGQEVDDFLGLVTGRQPLGPSTIRVYVADLAPHEGRASLRRGVPILRGDDGEYYAEVQITAYD